MKLLFNAGKSGSFALLLLRLSLGTLFLFAGAKKVLNLQEFIESVQAMGKMNDTAAFVLAFALPFMQMLFGALYVIGLFTPLTSFAISVMCISIIFVQGPWHEELPFSPVFVFLACAIGTMISGAGRISFDALVDRKDRGKAELQSGSGAIQVSPGHVKTGSSEIESQVELKEPDNKEG